MPSRDQRVKQAIENAKISLDGINETIKRHKLHMEEELAEKGYNFPPTPDQLKEVVRRVSHLLDIEGRPNPKRSGRSRFRQFELGEWRLSRLWTGDIVVDINGAKMLVASSTGLDYHNGRIAELLPALRRRQLLDDIADV